MELGTILLLIFGIVIYFLPGLFAVLSEREDKSSIIIVNILLGWTVVGWIIAFLLCFQEDEQ